VRHQLPAASFQLPVRRLVARWPLVAGCWKLVTGLCSFLLLLTGCAGRGGIPARPAPELLPAGSPLRSQSLADGDAWLRHHLRYAEYPQALQAVGAGSPLAPSDRLLRALQEGIVLHQAGEHARSNAVLEWAEVEADRRYTRSLARAAGALVLNDGVLAYTPSETELAMVPYYRMLNYLALGQLEGAVVEARKANALLARLSPEPRRRCRRDGMLQYMAGLVQEAGGEMNDALVSLRLAEQAFEGCESPPAGMATAVGTDLHRVAVAAGARELADSVAQRHGVKPDTAPAGRLLLLVEHGFVAHRAEEALHVPILPEEVDGLESSDADGIFAAAGRISERLVDTFQQRAVWGRAWSDTPAAQWAGMLEGGYVLKLAWPALRLEAARPAAVRVWLGDTVAAGSAEGKLSELLRDEVEAGRAAALTRLVARGVAKYLISREVEKRAEKKGGELTSFLVGRLTNLAANRLEQADLRSWSLLPDRISLVRASLPPGTHRLRIEAVEDGGEAAAHHLGAVTVDAGGLVVLSRRVWGTDSGVSAGP
jgi:hypothetical protein